MVNLIYFLMTLCDSSVALLQWSWDWYHCYN